MTSLGEMANKMSKDKLIPANCQYFLDTLCLTHQGGSNVLLPTLQRHPQRTVILLVTAVQVSPFLTKSLYDWLQMALDC